jgi:hypothetical protein
LIDRDASPATRIVTPARPLGSRGRSSVPEAARVEEAPVKSIHIPSNPRPRCPVCHNPVYSPAGIHPQCAVKAGESTAPRKPDPAVAARSDDAPDPA